MQFPADRENEGVGRLERVDPVDVRCQQRLREGVQHGLGPAGTLRTRVFRDVSVRELLDREFIDWGPFFSAWELAGRFPEILKDEVVGTEATKLYDDARALLDRIIGEKWFSPRAVIGFWPANSVGDDIEVYADESRSRVHPGSSLRSVGRPL